LAKRPKIQLLFYRLPAGGEPVRDWLKSLDDPAKRAIGLDLMRVQWRWPIGMPLCRAMGEVLWEVRTSLPNGRISRVLFCFHGQALVARHGFIKKSQKTPEGDLELARKRQKELER
jgi:phage-related protein